MLKTVLVSLIASFTLFQSNTGSNGSKALEALAASMQPGTWAELPQSNINAVLGQGSSAGNRITYANSAVWAPGQQILHFTGCDHYEGAYYHVSYSAATNTWTDLGATPLDGVAHGYDHNVIDPVTGTLYVRETGIGNNLIWSLPPGGSWSKAASWPKQGYIQFTAGTAWWSGELKGVGDTGALIVYNSGAANGEIQIWDRRANKWLRSIVGFGGSNTYHAFAEYSDVHNVAVFGGGNENARKVWRMDSDRTVAALTDAPVDLGIQRANVTVDPVTGNFLVMGYGQLWELDPRGKGSWTLQAGSRTPPGGVGNPGYPSFDSVVSAPISNFGVVTYIMCRAKTCRMYMYKHAGSESRPPVQAPTHPPAALAPDVVEKQLPSASASVTSSDITARPPSPSDFATRCTAPGVVKCVSFDSQADIAGRWGSPQGSVPKPTGIHPVIDTTIKASGNGSIRMTVPAGSAGGVVGDFFANFSNDYSVQFGENTDFYVQWRQRFDSGYIASARGSVGMKQVIIGTGSTASRPAASCTDLEIVTQNNSRKGVPQMYQNCGRYEPFQQGPQRSPHGSADFSIQNARPNAPGCWNYAPDFAHLVPPLGNCVQYFPNEWMTFQVHVHPGPLTQINGAWWFANSHVDVWVAREGEPSVQTLNWGPYNLGPLADGNFQKYGQVWFLVYSGGDKYPVTSTTWYDELIISRTRIADPAGASR